MTKPSLRAIGEGLTKPQTFEQWRSTPVGQAFHVLDKDVRDSLYDDAMAHAFRAGQEAAADSPLMQQTLEELLEICDNMEQRASDDGYYLAMGEIRDKILSRFDR